MKGSIRPLRAVFTVAIAMTLATLACSTVTSPTKAPPTKEVPPTVAVESTDTSVPEPTLAAPTAPPAKPTKPAPSEAAPTQATQAGATYSDDFSDPSSGWGTGTSATSSADYGTNEFVMTVNKAKWFSWTTAGQTGLSDIHIEVTAQKLTATGSAAFGLICDYQDKNNYYMLGFTVDGYYGIIKTQDGKDTFLTSAKSVWEKTDKYQLNTQSYQIGADCAGGQLALYVDGAQVDSVSDSTFTKGDVGLFVNTFDQAKSAVHFANYVVTPFSAGGGGTQIGQVVFKDNFTDSTSGWDASNGTNHTTAYGNSDYVVTVSAASKIGWGNAQQSLSDIHVDVTAKSVGDAKDAAFGVICDYQDTNNFYYLGITSDGYYAIVKVKDNQDTFFTSAKNEWVKSTKFKLNAPTYQLGVDCAKGKLGLYVDGIQIDTATDTTFTDGDIGLFAGTFDVPNAEVHFSSLVATSLK